LPKTEDVIRRSDKVELTRIGFDALKKEGIGLEPTVVLAQKKRYLDFLNQLRRENEGDDTADSPGYSLNLVRVPVSLLPGKRTQVGFGAEATFTLTPVLGDELLPQTFRRLVANDLVSQIGFSLTTFLHNPQAVARFLKPEYKQVLEGQELIEHINAIILEGQALERLGFLCGLTREDSTRLDQASGQLDPVQRGKLKELIDKVCP